MLRRHVCYASLIALSLPRCGGRTERQEGVQNPTAGEEFSVFLAEAGASQVSGDLSPVQACALTAEAYGALMLRCWCAAESCSAEWYFDVTCEDADEFTVEEQLECRDHWLTVSCEAYYGVFYLGDGPCLEERGWSEWEEACATAALAWEEVNIRCGCATADTCSGEWYLRYGYGCRDSMNTEAEELFECRDHWRTISCEQFQSDQETGSGPCW